METKQITVVVPTTILEYLTPLFLEIYDVNATKIVQKAYDYCTNTLNEEERKEQLANVASKYYMLFVNKRETKTIHIKTVENMKQYQASNLILLYVLIYMQYMEDLLEVPEEKRFNV